MNDQSKRGYSHMAFYQLYLVAESKRQRLLYLLDERVSFFYVFADFCLSK